ncbi:hypothetical protein AVEN_196890-1 [Araneus ventricosus]|uniref:Uncharacterized protein n=1 Tax=Araneus ventricosus TaxID=182803 RepID=A0A4Y2EF99_ARAVE|nr:hypothetical protein AVEN_196890-1 [Araneus ventricosus]
MAYPRNTGRRQAKPCVYSREMIIIPTSTFPPAWPDEEAHRISARRGGTGSMDLKFVFFCVIVNLSRRLMERKCQRHCLLRQTDVPAFRILNPLWTPLSAAVPREPHTYLIYIYIRNSTT